MTERVEWVRAQLAELKPAERRALGLIGAGYSYREVGEITGWTYTKINRCLSEGRAALRASRARGVGTATPPPEGEVGFASVLASWSTTAPITRC